MEETLLSPAVENYLKAIYLLEAKTGKPVPTSKIAKRLAVAPASVTEMVQRLARDGLVNHVRYRGVRLTAEGRRFALTVVRRHRLLETFLVSELGMGWEEVHDEAEALEHSISDRLLRAIAAKLGDPERDPHGDPIPSADLEIDEAETVSLDRLPLGARGHLVRVLDSRQRTARLPRPPRRPSGRRGRGARPRAFRRPLHRRLWGTPAQPGPARRRRLGRGGELT